MRSTTVALVLLVAAGTSTATPAVALDGSEGAGRILGRTTPDWSVEVVTDDLDLPLGHQSRRRPDRVD